MTRELLIVELIEVGILLLIISFLVELNSKKSFVGLSFVKECS